MALITIAIKSTKIISTKSMTLEADGVDKKLDDEVDEIIERRFPKRQNNMQDRHVTPSFEIRKTKQLSFHRKLENMVLFQTGYSQAYISEKSGIPQCQLSRYFSGKAKPTIDNLMKILRVVILKFDNPDVYKNALYNLLNPFQTESKEK
jgi:DNA-binding phage protein